MVTVNRITRDELVDRIADALVEHRMDVHDFVAKGRAGELDDSNLVDLWRLWGDMLPEATS